MNRIVSIECCFSQRMNGNLRNFTAGQYRDGLQIQRIMMMLLKWMKSMMIPLDHIHRVVVACCFLGLFLLGSTKGNFLKSVSSWTTCPEKVSFKKSRARERERERQSLLSYRNPEVRRLGTYGIS